MAAENFRKTVLATLLAASALPGIAGGADDTKPIGDFKQRGKTITIYSIGPAFVSDTRDADEFALSVADRMRAYTALNGVEVCTTICKAEDGTLGGLLTTIKSAAVCPRTDACPKGMTATDLDVHTHVHTDEYLPNDIDRAFLKQNYDNRQKVSTEPEKFSPGDFDGGSGYLVSENEVKFQSGRKKIRVLDGGGSAPKSSGGI